MKGVELGKRYLLLKKITPLFIMGMAILLAVFNVELFLKSYQILLLFFIIYLILLILATNGITAYFHKQIKMLLYEEIDPEALIECISYLETKGKVDPYLYQFLIEAYYYVNEIEKADEILTLYKSYFRKRYKIFYTTINIRIAIEKKDAERLVFYYDKLKKEENSNDVLMNHLYCQMIIAMDKNNAFKMDQILSKMKANIRYPLDEIEVSYFYGKYYLMINEVYHAQEIFHNLVTQKHTMIYKELAQKEENM